MTGCAGNHQVVPLSESGRTNVKREARTETKASRLWLGMCQYNFMMASRRDAGLLASSASWMFSSHSAILAED